MKLSELSKKICENYIAEIDDKDGYKFDIMTIMMVASLMTEIVRMYRDCKKPAPDVVTSLKSPSIGEKFLLRRTLIENMGRSEFRRSGQAMASAILSSTNNLTAQDVQDLYDEDAKDD